MQRVDSPSGSPPASRPGTARAAPGRTTSSNSRPGTGTGVRTRSTAAAAAGGGGGGSAAAAGGTGGGEEDEAAIAGALLNGTEAKMRLTELVGEELAAQLGDPMWKVREWHACARCSFWWWIDVCGTTRVVPVPSPLGMDACTSFTMQTHSQWWCHVDEACLSLVPMLCQRRVGNIQGC